MHPNDLVLNAYVDDELAPADRQDVERHLAECPSCRTLVADFSRLQRDAQALPAIEPPGRVWNAVNGSIRPIERGPSPAGRFAWTRRPWTWAAAAVLVIGIAAASRLAVQRPSTGAGAVMPQASVESVETELKAAEEHYQKAITGLEQITRTEQGALDPATAATLQKNLAVIDQAINESRSALRTEPGNQPAQQSLLESFKAKLSLLQDTVALINEMRKGDEAGAARIVSGIKQKDE